MENEYAATDTLSTRTVVVMYAVYSAHTAALAWAAGRRIWPAPLPRRASRAVGTALITLGSGVALTGAEPFGAGKQISGIEPGSLHATGVYRYSRNPQYLGLGLAATGFAIAARSAFTGLVAAGVWTAYHRWIPNEERHLARVFGKEYLNYQNQVRRWLGTRATTSAAR